MSRLEWVLGILLVLLLIVVLGLSALLWLRPRMPEMPEGLPPTAVASSQPAQSSSDGKTALAAYAMAQRAVQDWHSDAVLLNASATWPRSANANELGKGLANWAYTFYSPGNNSITLVSVRGDDARRLSESVYNQPAAPLDAGGWRLDSQQAVQVFLNNGGAQFLQEQGPSTLLMQLTTSEAQVTWFLSLYAEGSGRSYSMRINATTGDVLQVEAVP